MIGKRIRGYLIERKLSESGMGEVYLAKDELNRDVALKFIRASLINQPQAAARFIREARAASRLNHPNIVTIHGTGEDEEAGRFIVMEFVDGVTLRSYVGKKLELNALLSIFAQTAEALAAAHGAGVIHRDIKPENIMVRNDGYVKVVDFGLARWEPKKSGTDVDGTRTASGTLFGTLRYMSPEQAGGKRADAATDIFSLGIVMYELVTGRHPFEAFSELETLMAIAARPILPPTRWAPHVPVPLENLILRMLDRTARQRIPAQQVIDEIENIVNSIDVDHYTAVPEPMQRLVGRRHERVQLRAVLDSTLQGHGLLVLLEGEPGIGKTALVESFLSELTTSHRGCAIGRGLCSERLAGAEAYLPLLEALEGLIRETSSLSELMQRVAPNWYGQVVRQAAPDQASESAGKLRPTSRELLNRELAAFLDEGSKIVPLVLFLDDLHWADESTIDLLAYIATKFDSMRILILATYRPEEAVLNNARFIQIARDLEARRRCRKIVLDFLTVADVEAYLTLEFPGNNFPAAFSRLIQVKTEGTPFFMVEVLRYLRDRQFISESGGVWTLSEKLPEIERDLPQSIVVMIQRKIDFVSDVDRRLLSAASVQGFEFDSPVVARLLDMQAVDLEERLDKLQRVHNLVQALGVKELPNRTRASHYRFVHIFYYRSFYDGILPARKELWSATAAQTLVELYRDHVEDIGPQIAFLFEAAHNYEQASRYFSFAARHATKLFAYPEAALLARRGLAMLQARGGTPPPLEELTLQLALAIPLGALNGYGNLEVQKTYDRARELSVQLGENPLIFPALWGLLAYYASRLEIPPATDVSELFMRLAQNSQEPTQLSGAHLSVGLVKFFSGDLESAVEHLGQYRSLDNPEAGIAIAQRYGLEFEIIMRGFESRVLWYLGYPDKSVNTLNAALNRARKLAHAPTLALVTSLAGLTHQARGEVDSVDVLAKELIELGKEHKLQLWNAEGLFFHGWVTAERSNDKSKGIALMKEGLASYRATGTEILLPCGYSIVSEMLGISGRADEGLELIRKTAQLPYMSYAAFYRADLLRVEGDLLAAIGQSQAAEAKLMEALQVARKQKAKAFELRAATSLSKFWFAKRQAARGRKLLGPVYDWFAEGFETADLKKAKSQLFTPVKAKAHTR